MWSTKWYTEKTFTGILYNLDGWMGEHWDNLRFLTEITAKIIIDMCLYLVSKIVKSANSISSITRCSIFHNYDE